MQVVTPWQAAESPVWWRQNLAWGAGLLAVLLAGSALVSWVAANWPQMAPQARLALVQGALALTVLLAAGLAWRDSRWAGLLTGVAALGVGGLLALLGQIYQTGADRWQLFLLWAALITPWLLLMPSVLLALLWAALLNLSLWLAADGWTTLHRWAWVDDGAMVAACLLVVLNAGLLGLAECLHHRLRDSWRLVRRVLAVAVLGWAFIAVVQGLWLGPRLAAAPGLLAGLAPVAVLYGVYAYGRRDLAVVALSLLAGIGMVGVWWLQMLDSISGVLGLSLLLLVLTLLALRHVMHLWRSTGGSAAGPAAADPDLDRSAMAPWYLTVLRVGAMTPVLLLLGVWVAVSFELDSAADALVAGVLLMLPGLLAERMTIRDLWREVGAVLVVLGLLLCAGGAVLLVDEGGDRVTSLLALTAVGSAAYLFTRQSAVRLVAAMLVLGIGFWLTGPDADAVAWPSDASGIEASQLAWRLWGFLAAGTGLWIWSVRASHRTVWRPLAWALMAMAAGVALLIAQAMPAPAWRWPWFGQAAMFLCALLPGLLLAAGMAAVRPALPAGLRVGAPLACCVAGLGWVNVPVLSVALVWLVLGRLTGGRILQVLSVPLGMLGLLLHYLDMQAGSLLTKAAVLGVTAAWLAALAVCLVVRHRQSVPRSSGVRRRRLPAGVLAGGLLVLGLAQTQVQHYETILSQGRQVVLALAPVDPRSLMQGDYMVLDYAVRRAAHNWLRISTADEQAVSAAGRGWLLLQRDDQGVWQLQGVAATLPPPTPDAVALTFRWRKGRADFGADNWFFAEGQGERFAKAKYGVLRVAADGTALLAGLLDESQQPL
ncbi:GDYXXLXY domain-containing protein [Castellaniella sp.]|uniref:GDYXXLXY domain-containing protein n=1 Tax=Castellaniella sp. TaxID=1955812 RepID=UPI002AFFBABD|nr:GDYXXLXY domain-containing protein [Castellaniella sp.]